MDMGQETYQKKSFDAHRYEIPSTQSAYHNLPTIGGVQQGVGPMFCATDLAVRCKRPVRTAWHGACQSVSARGPSEELAPHGNT